MVRGSGPSRGPRRDAACGKGRAARAGGSGQSRVWVGCPGVPGGVWGFTVRAGCAGRPGTPEGCRHRFPASFLRRAAVSWKSAERSRALRVWAERPEASAGLAGGNVVQEPERCAPARGRRVCCLREARPGVWRGPRTHPRGARLELQAPPRQDSTLPRRRWTRDDLGTPRVSPVRNEFPQCRSLGQRAQAGGQPLSPHT